MFVLDDLLFKPFISLLDILHTLALDELYDVEGLRDELKENRLLFELGERHRQQYEHRKRELEAELERAEQIKHQMQGRFEVKR